MSVYLRQAEPPGPADLPDGVGRDLVAAGHLQNAPGFNLEELGDYFFVDEGLERGDCRLGECGL
jgi:hypothetical protein